MSESRYFEDLTIGETMRSRGRTITEADVVQFAGLSGDYSRLHTDAAFMAESNFGERIAHGLLGLAVQSGLSVGTIHPPVRTVAFLSIKEWNFVAPIFFGDTIQLEITIAGKRLTSRGDRGVVDWERTLINQDGKTVQRGIMQTLVHCRPTTTP